LSLIHSQLTKSVSWWLYEEHHKLLTCNHLTELSVSRPPRIDSQEFGVESGWGDRILAEV